MSKPTSRRFRSASIGLLAFPLLPQAWGAGLTSPSKPGPDADRPPFVFERNGVFGIPWGAGNYTWPEQLFWEHKSQIRDKRQEMLDATAGIEGDGRVPVMSCVAWGYEYRAAIGGDASQGLQDMSRQEGWQQYGEWLQPRKDKYFALDWDGNVFYPSAGYVTPLMPLDAVDWPAGIPSATFGDFAGDRLGRLANHLNIRGFFAADFVVGLYGGNHDFHPRVLDDFESWSGIDLPGSTVKQRAEALKTRHWSRWNDFKSERMARFYARAAETIRASGREPLVGGQILPHAALVRSTGNDFRTYLKWLPARNWFFQVELQSDDGRPVPEYWTASTNMGGHAARVPMMGLGAHMDAYAPAFSAALKGQGKDEAWGRLYMKHAWLSVGWTHVANLDGSVRRATVSFQRGYWDAGGVDTPIVALLRERVPRHPFGPAFYYSTDLERQSEGSGNPGFYYWFEPRVQGWRAEGVPSGYFVSDTALAGLEADTANWPSGWLVYVDNLGFTRLSAQERARLERIAPIVDETSLRETSPLFFTGDSLGGFGFVDQTGSVMVVVSNGSHSRRTGSIEFRRVVDSTYQLREHLGATDTRLTVRGGEASFRITLAPRETRVFEIPGLRERSKVGRMSPGRPLPPLAVPAGILRPQGLRLDALGRRSLEGPGVHWSAPEP